MNITWHGHSCFRIIAQGDKKSKEKTTLVIDPYEDSIGIKLPKIGADILLITHEHKDHNNRDAVNGKSFVIDSPGEYEIRGVFIEGVTSFHDDKKGSERGLNTIFTVEAEGIRVCHLGDFGEEELSDKQLAAIGNVDVLMIPVGGNYTIDAKKATKIISQIEPRIVIPMHYYIPGLKVEVGDLDEFLKAIGEKKATPQEKIVLQKKSLPSGEMSILPLIPQTKGK